MPTRITATELSRGLADILSRVHYRGEQFLIERNGTAVGLLAPAPRRGPTWSELIDLATTLRTGDPSFANDLSTTRAAQGEPQVRDWPS